MHAIRKPVVVGLDAKPQIYFHPTDRYEDTILHGRKRLGEGGVVEGIDGHLPTNSDLARVYSPFTSASDHV